MMTEEQKQDMKGQIREIFMRNGFTIKDGQSDLKDYVYSAAHELIDALSQPASPALKLPDAKPVDLADGNWDDVSLAENIGFNRCLLEVKRINAPHTAPIEPICATGGAEWVKVSNNTPEPNSKVIAYTAYGEMIFDMHYMWSKYDKEWMTEYSLWRGAVTHWMYHPAAPED